MSEFFERWNRAIQKSGERHRQKMDEMQKERVDELNAFLRSFPTKLQAAIFKMAEEKLGWTFCIVITPNHSFVARKDKDEKHEYQASDEDIKTFAVVCRMAEEIIRLREKK
jgi:hypothetical protein